MFKAKFIHTILHGQKLPSDVSRIWTDSRSISKGDLFVSIIGENFDGHDFIFLAAEKGAVGAVVSKKTFKNKDKLPQNFALIEVKDCTQALRKLAKAYRETLKIPIFAVAGSNGKTTTKEWIAFLLEQLFGKKNVFKTEKSQNSILGIALSLLQIRNEKFAVIEIGIDEPGWMEQHLEVVQPTHGLITTIAEEHLNKLKNIKTIAKEELKLFHFLNSRSGGFAANLDSSWIADELQKSKRKSKMNKLTYALDQTAHIEGRFIPPQTLHAFGFHYFSPLPGKHNAQNLLAALTAICLLDPNLTSEQLLRLSQACRSFEGEKHRSRWIEIPKQIRVYDDCYNANPDSMEKALQSFIELSDGCRQHIVLGDMLDLGNSSAESHKRLLNQVMVLNFDRIYLLGSEFEKAFEDLLIKDKRVQSFKTLDALEIDLKSRLKPAETIFVKGSRGMALERLVEKLQNN